MPLSLAKIATNTASVTLEIDGESLTIEYYPGRVTEKMFSILRSMNSINEDSFEQAFTDYNQMLAGLVKAWDLYEDNERTLMFPVEAARFAELPLGFRMQVFAAILGDIRPEVLATQNGKAPR